MVRAVVIRNILPAVFIGASRMVIMGDIANAAPREPNENTFSFL